MRVNDLKLDRVYYFMETLGEKSFVCKNAHEVRKKIHDLKVLNRKNTGVYYGNINVLEDNTITYTEFGIIDIKEDIDKLYVESKNITELKKKLSKELKGKKKPILCTSVDGLIKTVTRKESPKRLLLVEEIDPSDRHVMLFEGDTKDSAHDKDIFYNYNLIPDARYIYYRKDLGMDYDTYKSRYTYKVYRVIEKATYLEEMDEILSKVQNEYTAREKYHINDESNLIIIKLPDLKKYPVMYQTDKMYISKDSVLKSFEARIDDIELIDRLIMDPYTNLQATIFDEDIMGELSDYETKRNKILRDKKYLKGELTQYKLLKEKGTQTIEDIKNLDNQKIYVKAALRTLLFDLIYKNKEKKQINYSLLRHLAALIKERDLELEEMKDEYFDFLLKDIDEQIKNGTITETQFIKYRL